MYLDTNFLEGEFPFLSNYGQLPSLVFLRLHDNYLTGKIPTSFGYLVSLQRVSLANNHLGGAIPSSLGNLVALTELYLGGNRLSGQIPNWSTFSAYSLKYVSQFVSMTIASWDVITPKPSNTWSFIQNQVFKPLYHTTVAGRIAISFQDLLGKMWNPRQHSRVRYRSWTYQLTISVEAFHHGLEASLSCTC